MPRKPRTKANGEGSLFKRATVHKDGTKSERWHAELELGVDAAGKRLRWRYAAKTRKEAADALAAVLADRRKGLPVFNDRLTVREYLTEWLESLTDRGPITRANYARMVKHHLIPALGTYRLLDLAPAHVQRMLAAKLAGDLAPSTVNKIRAVLSTALADAVREERIARNVAELSRPVREEPAEHTPLNAEQLQTFLAHIRGLREEALYLTTITLGLRQGEVLGLRWADVALDERRVVIQSALKRADGVTFLGDVKGKRKRRSLPLPAFLASTLGEHRGRQALERQRASWKEQDFVFATRNGTPLSRRNVDRQFTGLLEAAKLPHIAFHDLRHSCATLLMAGGVDARIIMEILGHSGIDVTMNVYAHVAPTSTALKDALDGLGDALGIYSRSTPVIDLDERRERKAPG